MNEFVSSQKMGRNKFKKRENEINQRGSSDAELGEALFQSGEGLMDVVKNLTKKGATKLSQKVGEKVGRKLVDAAFKKTAKSGAKRSPERGNEIINELYQSPENSGDEIFKILSSASKQTSQKEPKISEQRTGQRSKKMTQQEINERLNMLMNL